MPGLSKESTDSGELNVSLEDGYKAPSRNRCAEAKETVDKNGLLAAPLVTYPLWMRISDRKEERSRLIFLMRNAERVDRIFGTDWLDTELVDGKFLPTDQNIPPSLAKLSQFTTFELDSPITSIGHYTTKLVARGLAQRGAAPRLIVCSPALRCVQTAIAAAEYFKAKVCIEWGLAEPREWFRNANGQCLAPPHVTPEQLKQLGFPIDIAYYPVISREQFEQKGNLESELDSKLRIDFVLRYLGSMERRGPLLLVSHALTLDIAVKIAESCKSSEEASEAMDDEFTSPCRSLSNMADGSREGDCAKIDEKLCQEYLEQPVDLLHLGIKFPYGSLVCLARVGCSVPFRYRLLRNMIPPLTLGTHFCSRPLID